MGSQNTVTPLDQPSSGKTHQGLIDTTAEVTPLTNPLAFHTIDWVPGPSGTPVFMGTSSNWAFNRRVLSMTHEATTGTALSPENLFFDGKVYGLRWDGGRGASSAEDFSPAHLPTQDFAIYLINSVKSHCCRLFYLFEEHSFMENFATFHANAADQSKVPRLWYVHYLILLAFGKAFVVQTSNSQQPPGADLFVQAMKLMPDFTFFECDYVETMQVLCCMSLYLHCISSRPAAYRYIGQALSTAFEHGLHTEMQSHHLDETYVQRCRLAWWTIYVLERQMSALMGVPMFISDECVCTPFPIFCEQAQRTGALHIQIKLAQVLGQIHQTVYGIEGQLDSRYLGATKSVLQSIAGLAADLHGLFDIDSGENTSGVSRVSAHLHLQYHQCIVLITRPLLFIFLQSKLGQSESVLMQWLHSDSVRSLLQVCTDCSRQIIKILSRLLSQGFLAAVAISMAAAIDPTLFSEHAAWSQRVFLILEEMNSHGSKIAGMIASELRQLDGYLHPTHTVASYPTNQALGLEFGQGLAMDAELSTDLLIDIANSLDPESLGWDFPVTDG
ncbi:fungal-specific transcription factor domain-containing protein [Colletotrichum phormii]|uniref:Fungal-specific transcription factor domain-containing protein n=1 Tax=Colletotrichum phormii TaxID=359342 RepID=A0AAI9ZBW1_9PEZI|nr:fungal-specific transcription factor domain-containing protein [Colletotrichum phormii]KAK1613493.1 fungal-specific transcription factor domain-containing protein [Colletotrichum phormii]